MKQSIANEIVNILQKTNLYPRDLAERLSVNHITVVSKLADPTQKSVVDFRAEGKNKVYFLKRTIEA